ncbi:serine protease family S10, partial [Achlya hypogyna]
MTAAAHKLSSLPGYADEAPIPFDQYAGHLQLPSNGQKMFYWHVEAAANASTAPLVLWLNGGPGCSSLGGFFTELGPFVVNSDLSVARNPYAWNRKVNMVFLESPSGVGFSTPVLDSSNYTDDFTTDRIYEFLKQFLQAYPAYADRDFYVTGESYAGMYIPFLAHTLVTKPLPSLGFKGFAIGNAYTDTTIDNASVLDYYYYHAMISPEAYRAIQAACPTDAIKAACLDGAASCPKACSGPLNDALDRIESDKLDAYYIYGDVCLLPEGATQALRHIRPMHRGVYGPCRDVFTQDYLRQAKVQAALHIDTGFVNWTDCSDVVGNAYHGSASSLAKYPAILQSGAKVLIYSGDADTVVNFVG